MIAQYIEYRKLKCGIQISFRIRLVDFQDMDALLRMDFFKSNFKRVKLSKSKTKKLCSEHNFPKSTIARNFGNRTEFQKNMLI